MKTSIYLSARGISAVVGRDTGRKLKIASCHRTLLPSGIIHHGVIQDFDQLVTHLGDFFNTYRIKRSKVSLVIDSDGMSTRLLNVPILSHAKLCTVIRNEFSNDAESLFDDTLYDYTVVTPRTASGGGRILALAAERQVVERYREAFAKISVKLSGITITQTCAMAFFQRISEWKDSNFVFAYLEGNEVLSFLFADGEFLYSNRTQLNEQRGTPAAAVEISRALFAMKQYSYTHDRSTPLSNAYLSGLVGDEPQFYNDMVEALSMVVGPPPPSREIDSPYMQENGIDYGEYLFCLGSLID